MTIDAVQWLIAKTREGMSQRVISRTLGIPQSAVSRNLRRARAGQPLSPEMNAVILEHLRAE